MYDAWKTGWFDAEPEYPELVERTPQSKIDEAYDHLIALSIQMGSSKPDIDMMEFHLNEIASFIGVRKTIQINPEGSHE